MGIILASGSPRRKEFFQQLGVSFRIKIPEVEEVQFENPVETCVYNAIRKVRWVTENEEIQNDSIIIGFDTLVSIDKNILGKPANREESRKMLQRLSGKWHRVYTGVALWKREKILKDYEMTRVKFHKLTEPQIKHYVDCGESLDKAGSYGIQDKNISFIERIEGSFSNVVGFPMEVTRSLLKKAGIKI
ncbi:MAG: Maf family protein [candidate division WOR-3 bacterium]|nr:Maf family protein [candidate division WOR-3 bacterium]